MAALNHTHSYIKYKKTPVQGMIFRCNHPQCTHTSPKDLILGKLNKCACGNEHILTLEDLRRAVPKCLDCSNTREAREKREINKVLDAAGMTLNVQLPEEAKLR